jgi:hypothetical protein
MALRIVVFIAPYGRASSRIDAPGLDRLAALVPGSYVGPVTDEDRADEFGIRLRAEACARQQR